MPQFSQRANQLTSSLIREILAATQQPGVISFAGGLPATDLLPKLNWSSVPFDTEQYGMSEGEPALREAIARDAQKLGIRCTKDQVLVLSGSQQALDLVSKLFIDPATPVAMEAPTYLAALQSFRFFGADIRGLPTTATGLDCDALRALAREVTPAFTYLIPTFQNPSGLCYSRTAREKVARTLDELNIPLIEDEPYRELCYDEVDRTPVCALVERTSWVYMGTFSKTLAPGLRIGYLIASPDLFPWFVKLKQAADLHSNRPGQWLIAQWLGTPAFDAHLQALQTAYRSKRDTMQAILECHFTDLADWQKPAGGLFFWLTLKQACDTRQLLKTAMAEEKIAFMPGEPFYPTEGSVTGHLRFNFSLATPEQMEDGLSRLAGLIRRQMS
ncbi:MAG: PLP-dependent aminotransferase family protein [Laribacter sp.]|nr:PLP-dependent aminotransferase family protein [Laribacter sp.]MBP9528917.1 PLP-dependent aminotransferase family protein [Laribacter sp.]